MEYIPLEGQVILIALAVIFALAFGATWILIGLRESPREDYPLSIEGLAACKHKDERSRSALWWGMVLRCIVTRCED